MKFKNVLLMLLIILGLGGLTAGIVFYTDYYVYKSSAVLTLEKSKASAEMNEKNGDLEAFLEPVANADDVSAATAETGLDSSQDNQVGVDSTTSATIAESADITSPPVDGVSSATGDFGETGSSSDNTHYDEDDDDDDDEDDD